MILVLIPHCGDRALVERQARIILEANENSLAFFASCADMIEWVKKNEHVLTNDASRLHVLIDRGPGALKFSKPADAAIDMVREALSEALIILAAVAYKPITNCNVDGYFTRSSISALVHLVVALTHRPIKKVVEVKNENNMSDDNSMRLLYEGVGFVEQ